MPAAVLIYENTPMKRLAGSPGCRVLEPGEDESDISPDQLRILVDMESYKYLAASLGRSGLWRIERDPRIRRRLGQVVAFDSQDPAFLDALEECKEGEKRIQAAIDEIASGSHFKNVHRDRDGSAARLKFKLRPPLCIPVEPSGAARMSARRNQRVIVMHTTMDTHDVQLIRSVGRRTNLDHRITQMTKIMRQRPDWFREHYGDWEKWARVIVQCRKGFCWWR